MKYYTVDYMYNEERCWYVCDWYRNYIYNEEEAAYAEKPPFVPLATFEIDGEKYFVVDYPDAGLMILRREVGHYDSLEDIEDLTYYFNYTDFIREDEDV